ncbi:hypothetical protein D3C87_494040 [compost metagenome]
MGGCAGHQHRAQPPMGWLYQRLHTLLEQAMCIRHSLSACVAKGLHRTFKVIAASLLKLDEGPADTQAVFPVQIQQGIAAATIRVDPIHVDVLVHSTHEIDVVAKGRFARIYLEHRDAQMFDLADAVGIVQAHHSRPRAVARTEPGAVRMLGDPAPANAATGNKKQSCIVMGGPFWMKAGVNSFGTGRRHARLTGTAGSAQRQRCRCAHIMRRPRIK